LIRLPLLTGHPRFGAEGAGFCAHFAPKFSLSLTFKKRDELQGDCEWQNDR